MKNFLLGMLFMNLIHQVAKHIDFSGEEEIEETTAKR